MSTGPHVEHRHEPSLDASLDFINTLEFSGVASTDALSSEGAALDWLIAHELVHPDDASRLADRPEVLKRVRRVRGALREVAEAVFVHRAANPRALADVNRALRARSAVELIAAADGVSVGHRHAGDPIDDALARLAEPIVREIAEGRRERLRLCANESCRWVFIDTSPTGRRRWCDMSSCGNRAKAARHRARQLAGGQPAA